MPNPLCSMFTVRSRDQADAHRHFSPPWTVDDNGSCFIVRDNGRVLPVSRLPVHWQAHLRKRTCKQGSRPAMRGVLPVSFWFDDSKTRGGRRIGAAVKLLREP